MSGQAVSKNGIAIRLTDERWAHITEEHAELSDFRTSVLETILHPERILAGKGGELIAVRQIEQGKHLAVVYREHKEDGFVITAFITSKGRSLERRKKLWP